MREEGGGGVSKLRTVTASAALRTELADGQMEPALGGTKAWEAALEPAEVAARADDGEYGVGRGLKEVKREHVARDDGVVKGVEAERRAEQVEQRSARWT
jgi:hypothetical protein